MFKNKVTYFLLSILVVIIIMAGCGTANSSGSTTESAGGDLGSEAILNEDNGTVTVTYTVENRSEKDIELEFSSSLKADYIVYDESGEKVLQHSDGKMYAMAIETMTLEEAEKFESDFVIDELSPGTYTIELFLNTADHKAEIIEEFTITD